MTTKKYELTDEHRAMLPAWRDQWIANAMSTAPMSDDDRIDVSQAIGELYAAANLERPKHVAFVASPFIAAFAGGIAAAIWHCFKAGEMPQIKLNGPATGVRGAVLAACASILPDGLSIPAEECNPIPEDKGSEWWMFRCGAKGLCDEFGVGKFGLDCISRAWNMYQGGNLWSSYDSFLSFFLEVAGLEVDPSGGYKHWLVCARRSSYRIMHADFCIVSDRPETLTVDDDNQPHSEDGPFCQWRDGSRLFSIHGVRVPAWIIERPSEITAAAIREEDNAEVRRIMIERMGVGKYLTEIDAKVLDYDCHGTPRALMIDNEGRKWLCGTDGSTKRVYYMQAPNDAKTCREAHEGLSGMPEEGVIVQS